MGSWARSYAWRWRNWEKLLRLWAQSELLQGSKQQELAKRRFLRRFLAKEVLLHGTQHYSVPTGSGNFWNNCRDNLDMNTSILESLDFPVAQMVKNLPTMQETRVRSLGWEDPLEKGMAIHSSILVWRIPCTQKPGRLSCGHKESHDWVTNTHSCEQEGFTPKSPSGAAYNWELEKKSGETVNGHPWRQSDLETHTNPALLHCQILTWYTSRTPISSTSVHRKLTHWF